MAFYPKYQHLFFDLDNTLWDFETNARITMEQTVAELRIDSQIKDFEEFYSFYEKINADLWEAYQRQEIRKPELIRKRFEDTLSQFNIKGIDPVKMNELYLDIMPLQKALVSGVIETLDYLKSRNYRLYIISNGFKKVQTQKLKSSGLSVYFENLFVSEEIGAPKPDVRIFRYAFSYCNASKAKSLMIGDSLETDIIGAFNFGVDQVYVKNTKNIEIQDGDLNTNSIPNNINPTNGIDFSPTYIINDIKSLKDFL